MHPSLIILLCCVLLLLISGFRHLWNASDGEVASIIVIALGLMGLGSLVVTYTITRPVLATIPFEILGQVFVGLFVPLALIVAGFRFRFWVGIFLMLAISLILALP